MPPGSTSTEEEQCPDGSDKAESSQQTKEG